MHHISSPAPTTPSARLPWLVLWACLVASPLLGCDDHTAELDTRASADTTHPADAHAPESGSPTNTAGAADMHDAQTADLSDGGVVAPTCDGAAWVRTGGVLRTAPVTSSWLIMDCCDGFNLQFHVGQSSETDVHAMFRWMGASIPASGTWDVASLGDGLRISDCREGACPFVELAGATGWVSIVQPADQPGDTTPRIVALCVEGATREDGETIGLYSGDVPLAPYAWAERFAIFLLQDESLTVLDVEDQPLASLQLAPSPVLDLYNLTAYERATHVLETGGWSPLPGRVPAPGVFGRPFVVVADDVPIYLGAFTTPTSSWAPSVPSIDVDASQGGVIAIHPASSGTPPDVREDPRIMQVLRESGRLVP